MKKALILMFATFALAAAAGIVLAATSPAAATEPATNQTIAGKIVSVSDNAFSIEVQKGSDAATLEFVTDSSTKVEGTLQVGSAATVEYRIEGGKNIAVHVVVAQGS